MSLIRITPALVAVVVLTAGCVAQTPPGRQANSDPVLAGLHLFNDPSLSASGEVTCASCHPRGGHTNNRTYIGLEVVENGNPKGRSTPSLWGIRDTAPYSWSGTKNLKDNIRGIITGRMKGPEPTEKQLDQIIAYLNSIEFPDNPNLNADGSASDAAPAAARRGYEVFQRASCNICHVPPVFTKPDLEDIGSGGEFSVPSLRGVSTTAPYFHDGRFPNLRALIPIKLEFLLELGSDAKLSEQDIEDLLTYLNTL